MGISHWHKFLKDHKLFKKRYTKTDSDLAFTKAISSARRSAEAKLKEIEDLLSMREGPTDDM